MSVGMERPVTCSASSTTSRLGLWAWISCTQQQLLQTTISVLHSHLQSSRGPRELCRCEWRTLIVVCNNCCCVQEIQAQRPSLLVVEEAEQVTGLSIPTD